VTPDGGKPPLTWAFNSHGQLLTGQCAAIGQARGVPQTGQSSCCAFVFVDQAAEEIAAEDLFGGWRSGSAVAR
jgi:hypothetical protein